jgi:antitoxin ParD1/3/4
MGMTRKTITISGVMDDWIKTQIDAGRYANDSEYVRDLIRRDQERQEAISQARALVDQAHADAGRCRTASRLARDAESWTWSDGRSPPEPAG